MKKTLLIILFIFIFAVPCTVRCMAAKLSPLEKELEKRLPDIVGPAKKYTVKIMNTGILDLLSGDIKDMYLISEEVQPKNVPLLELVKVHLHNITFDIDKIEKIEKAGFIINLGQDSINKYLPEKIKEYPDIKMELTENLITINTNTKVWMFDLPVKVTGILEVENQKKVNFKCSKIKVGGVNLPDFVEKQLESKINPLVDLTEMKIITNILNIKLLDKKLQIEGNARTDAPIYYGGK